MKEIEELLRQHPFAQGLDDDIIALIAGCAKNVVFQWRSWDHIPVSETYMNTAASAFDYIHVNAYDIDQAAKIIAGSARSMGLEVVG